MPTCLPASPTSPSPPLPFPSRCFQTQDPTYHPHHGCAGILCRAFCRAVTDQGSLTLLTSLGSGSTLNLCTFSRALRVPPSHRERGQCLPPQLPLYHFLKSYLYGLPSVGRFLFLLLLLFLHACLSPLSLQQHLRRLYLGQTTYI